MDFPTARTARLSLREFVTRDRGALMAFPNDPGQLNYMLFSLATEAEVRDFMRVALAGRGSPARKEWHVAVELLPGEGGNGGKDPLWIGSVDLMAGEAGAVEAELGYFFLRDHWGKGYAVEAAEALLDFAFGPLGLHRVWGKCHTGNAGSARVMEKLGMTREGTIREHAWMRDHWRSSYLYGILAGEWKGSRS